MNPSGAFGFVKRHAAVAVFVLALVVAVVGVGAFYMALRSSTVELVPGDQRTWILRQRVTPLDEDGRPRADGRIRENVYRLNLLCLGPGGECALAASCQGDREGDGVELHHLHVSRDGTVARYDENRRPVPGGVRLGLFDFNLMPLPEGLAQAWKVRVPYAYPPPSERPVHGRVTRDQNGLCPVFILRLDPISWCRPVGTDDEQRYVQLRGFRCAYRYDPDDGVVDEAELHTRLELETASGIRAYAVRVTLDLEPVAPRAGTELLALANDGLLLQRYRRLRNPPDPELVARLRANPVDTGPWRRAVDRLLGDRARSADGAWAVRVASTSTRHRDAAEELRRSIVDAGYRAYIVNRGQRLLIEVGPYPERHDAVYRWLRERYGDNEPYWVRVEP